jgi:hypothetical protein
MSMLILLVFLTGAVLGARYRVLALVPAAAIALIAVFATGTALSLSLAAVVLMALAALVCLQIGYMGGLLTRYTATMARASPLPVLRRDQTRVLDEAAPLSPPAHSTGPRQTQYRG